MQNCGSFPSYSINMSCRQRCKNRAKKRGAENPEIPPILLKTNGHKMSLWSLATMSMITQAVTRRLPRYA